MGGLLVPERGVDALLAQVSTGETLARVVSPRTFEEMQALRSPADGVLFGVPRFYPGDGAYFVADLGDGEWITT